MDTVTSIASDRSHPMSTAELGRIQSERQRAQLNLDERVIETIKAQRALEAARAEEATALAAVEHQEKRVRDAILELKRGPC